MTDKQALAEFVRARSSDAFALLAQRYVDLVYSTARRMARDAHLAEDITQAVFIVLARRASSINPRYLAGWLVNTSRLAAREAIRARNRQKNREAQAAYMRSEIQTDDGPTAEQISPLLDDALAKLNAADRSAVVMRFLQGRSFADVGHELEISEEAARKRVERSIEKLRSILCKQGITASAGGLTVTLAAHQATAAPVALASQAALAISSQSAGAAAVAKGVVWTMSVAKAQLAAFFSLIAFGLIGVCVIAIAKAQHNPGPASSASATTLPTSQPVLAEEKIEPNDRLLVSIKNLVALGNITNIRRRVDPLGKIDLPWVDQVDVGSKSPSEAAIAVNKAFTDAQIIRPGNVTVEFVERGSEISIPYEPFKPGDHLMVHIWYPTTISNSPDSVTLALVDQNGAIEPPELIEALSAGQPKLGSLKIQGMTEFEAEKALLTAYHSRKPGSDPMLMIERISAKEAAAREYVKLHPD